MSRPVKTRIVFDIISTRDAALISAIDMDTALQRQIRALHPCIFSKYSSKVSDNTNTEHQITLDLYGPVSDRWRDA